MFYSKLNFVFQNIILDFKKKKKNAILIFSKNLRWKNTDEFD